MIYALILHLWRELAESITGLRKVTDGKIYLEGENITSLAPGEITERMLSYIPEERMRDGMIQEFTVAENMILREHHKMPYSRNGFLNLRDISKHADQLIRQFHVKTPSYETHAKNLSGGNIQKIVLAREISRNPRAIIAAQPTRGLDIGASEYVREQLLEERRKGTAIMLISEDLDEILALSDAVEVHYQIVGSHPWGKQLLPAHHRHRGGVGEQAGVRARARRVVGAVEQRG